MAAHDRALGPTQCGNTEVDYEVREGWTQTRCRLAYAGSRLKRATPGKAPPDRPAFQPYWGKPAVRNDREGRGDVGIGPIRASTLPDCGGCPVMDIPTAIDFNGSFAGVRNLGAKFVSPVKVEIFNFRSLGENVGVIFD